MLVKDELVTQINQRWHHGRAMPGSWAHVGQGDAEWMPRGFCDWPMDEVGSSSQRTRGGLDGEGEAKKLMKKLC